MGWVDPAVDVLGAALPTAEVTVIDGTGHVPHRTHPEAYAGVVRPFIEVGT